MLGLAKLSPRYLCKTRMTEIFSDGADTVGTVLRTDKFSDVSIIQKIHEERASQNVSSFVFRPPLQHSFPRRGAGSRVCGCFSRFLGAAVGPYEHHGCQGS